jgi:hypothetical protein
MSTYDHFKENPGFKLWNVVNVKKPDEKTWRMDLINREKDEIAIVDIRKMTLAELQTRINEFNAFYCAREDMGITVINTNECYMTGVAIHNTSQKNYEDHIKHFEEHGLTDNIVFKMGKKDRETAMAMYEAWKNLPQQPLENCINTWEPRKCYFGLPNSICTWLVNYVRISKSKKSHCE